MENTKKIDWYTLAFMAFSTVWGFGNVLNGFVYFNGVQIGRAHVYSSHITRSRMPSSA